MDVHIRWMIRRDMPEVLDIEAASFEVPWIEDDFILQLRRRYCIGMVAVELTGLEPVGIAPDRVAGFMVYEFFKTRLNVLNFAVAPWCRRLGVGRQMVEKLIGKLSERRRKSITLTIRERNVQGQLFFRACGFRCVAVVEREYTDTDEDAYIMQRKRVVVVGQGDESMTIASRNGLRKARPGE